MSDPAIIAYAAAAVPSVRCLRCEYDLRGIPPEANCPECGTPVRTSLQRAEAEQAGRQPPLHLSSTIWLRAMSLACCVMIISMLLAGIDALRVLSGAGGETLDVVGIAVGLSGLAAKGIGLWLFGTREPLRHHRGGAGAGGDAASRYGVRTLAVASVALPFAMVPLMNRYPSPRVYDAASAAFAVLAGLAAWVAMRRLGAAARRAGRPVTAAVASTLAWASLPAWTAHAMRDSSIIIGEHSWWQLVAHPVIGTPRASW